jgi:hypothetical protein
MSKLLEIVPMTRDNLSYKMFGAVKDRGMTHLDVELGKVIKHVDGSASFYFSVNLLKIAPLEQIANHYGYPIEHLALSFDEAVSEFEKTVRQFNWIDYVYPPYWVSCLFEQNKTEYRVNEISQGHIITGFDEKNNWEYTAFYQNQTKTFSDYNLAQKWVEELVNKK